LEYPKVRKTPAETAGSQCSAYFTYSAKTKTTQAPVNLKRTRMAKLLNLDGELDFIEDFIPDREADAFLVRLQEDLAWQEENIIIAGRKIQVPRLVCWYGDPGARYRYSGVDHPPSIWTETLRALKERVEAKSGRRFNSVLGNLYRNGNDAMGWHADNEPELGPEPFIASLSFGAERRFELRHDKTRHNLSLTLSHGSLLLMGGRLQRHWRHRIPRMPGMQDPRINLTFRTIFPKS
jgi:alkylated DNA repair dioxygenase AlkB